MSEYEPRAGDRVSIEAEVEAVNERGLSFITPAGTHGLAKLDDCTLIDRPAPPLPTEPGTTGTATVRGVPGVRVMRTDSGGRLYWFSAVLVSGYIVHCDDDLRDFVPDPDTTTRCEASGMTRYACQARDICDCFEPRVVPEPACTCTRATSGHIVSLDPTCPAWDADPTPEPDPVCECGHGRGDHGWSLGRWDCNRFVGGRIVDCSCTAYRPAPTPQPEPFTFQRDDDGTLSMESAVFQALGAASTCWERTPTGVFDSDRAREIGDALLAELIDRLTKEGSE